MQFIYLISTTEEHPKYKIGRSKDPNKRLLQLQTSNASILEILYTFPSKYVTLLESKLHRIYKNTDSNNEWFYLGTEEVDNFLNTCQKIESTLLVLEENTYWQQNYMLKYLKD